MVIENIRKKFEIKIYNKILWKERRKLKEMKEEKKEDENKNKKVKNWFV